MFVNCVQHRDDKLHLLFAAWYHRPPAGLHVERYPAVCRGVIFFVTKHASLALPHHHSRIFMLRNLRWRMCIPSSGPRARSLARTHARACALASALVPIRFVSLPLPSGRTHARTHARARTHTRHTHLTFFLSSSSSSRPRADSVARYCDIRVRRDA